MYIDKEILTRQRQLERAAKTEAIRKQKEQEISNVIDRINRDTPSHELVAVAFPDGWFWRSDIPDSWFWRSDIPDNIEVGEVA